jgi:hypothetical protein
VELHGRAAPASLPAIDVRMVLQPEHRRDGERMLGAAVATLNVCSEWLGAVPRASLTLVDPPWRPAAAVPPDAVLMDRSPWWSTATSMTRELAVSRAVSRRFWRERIETAGLPPWFVDGLAEYVARRAVTALFSVDNPGPGYAFMEERYFGGFVPRFVRIRLLPEIHGALESAFLDDPAVAIVDHPSSPAHAQRLAGKALLTLGTLEQWLGRPVFDQILTEFTARSSARPTLADFARTASAISGQDLSWLFDEALGSSAVFDYAVDQVTSEREADGAFTTVVVVRRVGDARFTGTAAAPVGGFESGRGISLRVSFDDGRQRTDVWDGRARDKTFRYRSAARAVSAVVDPDRVLLLDVHRTNNSRSVTPRTGAAASQWALLWMAWLEHAILNYAALV